MKKSKLYTDKFKNEAVKLARNSGKSYNQIARDLGVTHTSLHAWIKKDRLINPNQSIDNIELKSLKKENLILKISRATFYRFLALPDNNICLAKLFVPLIRSTKSIFSFTETKILKHWQI